MKEKNNFKIKDKKFNVFIPLVNLLLFNKLDTPDFDSGNYKLSEDFIESAKSIGKINIEENEFFKARIYFFLTELNRVDRENVYDIIIRNEEYTYTMSISYALEYKNLKTSLSQEKLFLDLVSFKFDGELSKIVFLYFIFHFEDIFVYKFLEKNNITKSEYFDVVENLCCPKDFINRVF